MTTSDLSRRVDPYKLADQGASITRSIKFSSLPRVAELLGNHANDVAVEMHFSRDEEYRCILQGQLETRAEVICERCLGPVNQPITSEFTLCVVHSDEAARDIPRDYDPLIVTDHMVDILDIVEDEILLALPMFSYHADGDCDQQGRSFGGEKEQDAPAAESSETKQNPFSVLSTLKLKK